MSNSPTEADVIPAQVRAQGLTRAFIYKGPSMVPTFSPGCLLYVRPAAHDLALGDVVVFADGSAGGHVVHRIVSVTEAGLLTRGDNNRLRDGLPVRPEQLIGRVEIVDGGGNLRPVAGGRRGLWAARLGWAARRLGGWLRNPLRPLYRALRRSQALRPLLGGWLQGRLSTVCLETPGGPLVKTLYCGRTVARWWPQLDRFECDKPFDLVIFQPDSDGHEMGVM